MNIVLLVDSLHSIAAGSERQIYKLAEGLVAAKQHVEIVVLRHTDFTRSQPRLPCPLSSLEITSLSSWQALKKLRAFKRTLKNNHTDVLHAWFPDASLVAPLLLKFKSLKIITSRRDIGLIYQNKPLWLFRLARFTTTAIICNSEAVKRNVLQQERLNAQHAVTIYNGLENYSATGQDQQIYTHESSLKLILVANIKPVKRTLDAVKALRQLQQQGIMAELALVGEAQDKHYLADIKRYLKEHNLNQLVHFIGQVEEPRRLLAQADIGLLVSASEGLSNTLMEYMQQGLPSIASAVGGNPELIVHEKNGLLFNAGDITSLVQAIFYLHEHPQQAKSFALSAAEKINNQFSIDAMISQHLLLYRGNN